MTMENLDDLMRKKFEADDLANRFEFQEEYWEQAQALLEADERKRKRHRWLFWGRLSGGALLVAALAYWMYLHQPDGLKGRDLSTEQPQTTPSRESMTEAPHPMYPNPTTSAPAPAGNTPASDQSRSTSTPTPSSTHTQQPIHPGASPSRQSSGLADDTSAPSQKSSRSTQNRPSSAQKPAPPTTTERSGNIKIPTGTASAPTSNHPNTDATGTGKNAPSTTDTPTGTGLTSNPGQPTHDTPKGAESNQATGSDPRAADPLLLTPGPQRILSPLPLLPFAIPEQPLKPQPLPRVEPSLASLVKVHRDPRWALYASVGGSAFFPKTRDVAGGASAGVSVGYQWQHRWSLQSGMQWRLLPAAPFLTETAHPPQTANQLRYSFGYEQTRITLQPQYLHTLQIPLALRWHYRSSWWAEGGLTLNQLLGVRSRWSEQQATSLLPDGATTRRGVWTSTEGYRRLWVSPALGAGWQRGHWALGLRVMAVPTQVVPPTVPDQSVPKGWLPHAEMMLHWRIW